MSALDETMLLPSAQTPGISISKEELAALPMQKFEGPIHFVERDEDVGAACEMLRGESLLGFDIETRPSFRVGESHPPALLQLAGSDAVFVFRLQKIRDAAPLLGLLSDIAITKAGVALGDDLKKLRAVYSFEPAGFLDLGILAREQGFKQTGLRALAGLLLGFRISKKEQRSNWAAPFLTRSQIAYAATDAWASREIYRKLASAGA